jgi:hypothetical protein
VTVAGSSDGIAIEVTDADGAPPVTASAWSGVAMSVGIGIVFGVAIVTALGILLLEAQRRRDDRASAFQNRLAEPISREIGAAGVSVLPTVRIPLWNGATRPAVIRLTGRVPSPDVHDRVIRLVEREAAPLRYFRIEDHIHIERLGDDYRRRLA